MVAYRSEKTNVVLDTTKLMNPGINYLPYVFSSLKSLRVGEVFELVARRPFKLSETLKNDYCCETCHSGETYSTKISKRA